jgi:hypothetical protein
MLWLASTSVPVFLPGEYLPSNVDAVFRTIVLSGSPGIARENGLWKNTSGNTAHLVAQNFDAR